jgi:hypothetical protein
MIAKKLPYKPTADYLFLDEKRKLKPVTRIKKPITKFELKRDDPGFANASLSATS